MTVLIDRHYFQLSRKTLSKTVNIVASLHLPRQIRSFLFIHTHIFDWEYLK